jgi:hypothetical protein
VKLEFKKKGGCACEIKIEDKLFTRKFIVNNFKVCYNWNIQVMARLMVWTCLDLCNPLQGLWAL